MTGKTAKGDAELKNGNKYILVMLHRYDRNITCSNKLQNTCYSPVHSFIHSFVYSFIPQVFPEEFTHDRKYSWRWAAVSCGNGSLLVLQDYL